MDARLLQLADSGFPSGAFAHSAGLEALVQLGLLRGEEALGVRLRELVWHTAHGALPFLGAAHAGAGGVGAEEADRACELFLSGEVANRASRAQGQAFLLAAEAAFGLPAVSALRTRLPSAHLAPATGAALALAGFALEDARRLLLFGAVRSALSAAVRLGAAGPLRAQGILFGMHAVIDRALEETRGIGVGDACGAAPLLELAQQAHGRLYSRLFQS